MPRRPRRRRPARRRGRPGCFGGGAVAVVAGAAAAGGEAEGRVDGHDTGIRLGHEGGDAVVVEAAGLEAEDGEAAPVWVGGYRREAAAVVPFGAGLGRGGEVDAGDVGGGRHATMIAQRRSGQRPGGGEGK